MFNHRSTPCLAISARVVIKHTAQSEPGRTWPVADYRLITSGSAKSGPSRAVCFISDLGYPIWARPGHNTIYTSVEQKCSCILNQLRSLVQNEIQRLIVIRSGKPLIAMPYAGFLIFQTRPRSGTAFNYKLRRVQGISASEVCHNLLSWCALARLCILF